MGLGIDQIEIALMLREQFQDKSVLVVSVQYPPSYNDISNLALRAPELWRSDELRRISETTSQNFYKEFFKLLGAKKVESVDITDEEGADHLRDLSLPLDKDDPLKGAYDWVIEGGTAEHVTNPIIYFNNIFQFIAARGYYLLSLPSSNMMEHGFYQFSPTLFADLTFANMDNLKIEHLSMALCNQNFLLHSLYKDSVKIEGGELSLMNKYKLSKKRFHELGIMTGTMINSANSCSHPVSITALIAKLHDEELVYSFPQGEYRRNSLATVCPTTQKSLIENSRLVSNPIKLKYLMKALVVALPIPMSIRIYLYKFLNFVISHFKYK